jgi:uncharacterized protein YbaR (Trm112 family)
VEHGRTVSMQRRLLDILACPIDKHFPLEMLEFDANGETIVEGLLICRECARYYPISEEIPVMLPDNLRSRKEDIAFLEKWKGRIPDSVLKSGRPWNLITPQQSQT